MDDASLVMSFNCVWIARVGDAYGRVPAACSPTLPKAPSAQYPTIPEGMMFEVLVGCVALEQAVKENGITTIDPLVHCLMPDHNALRPFIW